ncbi:MAG: uncharacterized protein PWP67_934 [Clostridium butyricum]|nr:uncharacterized protein [Clostridium butyricum]
MSTLLIQVQFFSIWEILFISYYLIFCNKLNLIGDLISIFKRDDIDLVVLNSANPVLRHQIIKFGKLIFEESEDVKVEQKTVATVSTYNESLSGVRHHNY